MNHTFEVEVAMLKTKDGKILGADCAIFLCDLAFWCNCNRSSGSNFRDGRYWTFSTMGKLCERHPYWTKGQMRRIIDKCKSAGFIITGNYNKSAYDRTLWYSVSDEILSICRLPESGSITHKKEKSICAFEQMETLKNENESAQKDTPIPDSKTDIEKDIIPPTPFVPETDFGKDLQAAFDDWLAYKKEKRQAYKQTGLKSLITQIRKKSDEYGETAVADLIRECMSANWQGIIWDKLDKPKPEKPKSDSSWIDDLNVL